MIRVRDIVSALLSSAWRVAVPVVGVCFFVGTFFKGDADLEDMERPGKGRAVVSDHGAHVLVTMGDAGTENFSTCVVQDEGGTELARINLHKDGAATLEFGTSSTIRGSGVLSKSGRIDLGISADVKGQYMVSVQPDGSSVVTIVDRDGDRSRTLRLSPRGDVLGDQPGS
jgi:hypothetical protein